MAEYGVDVVRGLLLGFYPVAGADRASAADGRRSSSRRWACCSCCCRARAPARRAAAARCWLRAACGASSPLVAPNMFLGIHFNRYLLWAFPGAARAGRRRARRAGPRSRAATRGRDAPLFARGRGAARRCWALLSTLRFAVALRRDGGRGRTGATWPLARSGSRATLPPGVAMANMATSVEYLTGHRSLNLHGVTSPAFFGDRAGEREAGVLEALARLPAAERPPLPDHHRRRAQEGSPTLRELVAGRAALPHRELLRRDRGLPDALRPRRRHDAAAPPGDAGRPSRADGGGPPQRVRSRGRARARLRFRSRRRQPRLCAAPPASTSTPGAGAGRAWRDGGRAILGCERFRVRTVPGRDLVVVLRTAPRASPVTVLRAGRRGLASRSTSRRRT